MASRNPHVELLLLAVIGVCFYFVSGSIFIAVLSLFYETEAILANLNDPALQITYALFMQVFTFALSVLVVIKFTQLPFHVFIGLKKVQWKWVLITIAVFIGAYFFIGILNTINAQLEGVFPEGYFDGEQKAAEATLSLVTAGDGWQLFFNVVIIGLVTAICEELFFRGMLLGNLLFISKGNKHFAVIVSSLFFAALHQQMLHLLPLFFLGLCLGYLYVESKNLKYSILFHFLINSSQVVLAWSMA